MYRNKITKWGLDKNNKESEIKTIVRKRRERDAVGKKSAFRIRGRIEDPVETERYLKRKRLSLEIVLAESAPTPPGLECFTPSEVPSSPRTPEIFRVPEHIFTMIRDYITGSFEAATWVLEGPKQACYSVKSSQDATDALNNLCHCPLLACNFFDGGSPEEGKRMLVTALAGIKEVLRAEPVSLLDILFILVVYLQDCRRPEIIPPILGQVSGMAAIVLPAKHPIRQISESLVLLEPARRRALVVCAWQSAVHRFESILGPTHNTVMRFRADYIIAQTDDLGQVESSLRAILHKCIATHEEYNSSTLRIRGELASLLLERGEYAEAEGVARDSIALAASVDSVSARTDVIINLHIRAITQGELGRIDLAEANFRHAIELSVSSWGWRDSWTIKTLYSFEYYLSKWGKHASAAEIRKQWRAIVESLDVFV